MARTPRLLAVASGGGHWIELLRLRPAFEGWDIAYVSMFQNYGDAVPGARFYRVPDGSRLAKLALLKVLPRAVLIMMRERPDVIVSTGSAPMLAFLAIGRLLGSKSLWIDSMAQAEQMSSSGRIAKRIASAAVCQWPEVAAREHLEFWGAVL